MRYGNTESLLRITAEAQAEDGERLSDYLAYYAPTPDQLPSAAEVLADVMKLADRLAAALRAPLLEDYTGPVLIDGVASPQLFRQLLARGLAGQVDPVGSARRGPPGPDDLKMELIDAADSEGLKFGLRITSLQNRAGGPGGFGGRFGRGGGPGITRLVGDPITIYRVYVADGREEPIRGCEFGTVDLRSLRRIIAAGQVPAVHNNTGGSGAPSSVIAPAVLFEEVELSRIKRETEKKPLIDPPQAREIAKSGSMERAQPRKQANP